MTKSIIFLEDSCEVKDLWRAKCERVITTKRAKEMGWPSRPPHKSAFDHYIPLNVSRKDVLNQVEDKNILPRSPFICVNSKNDKSKYCHFYHDYDHDMEDYFELKEKIEALIWKGQLRQFMSKLDRCKERPNNNQQPAPHVKIDPKPLKEIKTIMGGPSRFGSSHKSKKGL